MVNGLATAAGCQLVASCDIAVASDKSSFATPGVNIGLFCTTPGVALGRAVPTKVIHPCASLAVTLWGSGGPSPSPLVKGPSGAMWRGGQPLSLALLSERSTLELVFHCRRPSARFWAGLVCFRKGTRIS